MYIPYNYNIIIFKSYKKILIKIYNLKKTIKIPFSKNNEIFVDKHTNCILFNKYKIKINWNLIINQINKNLFLFENIFFNKIKFKGKGFRVRFKKNLKILKFTFGHSHINYIFINDKTTKVKRLGKYKYIFKNKNYSKMDLFLKKICKIKPINMYTKRGIRKSKQIIYKRKGKKSTYI